MKRRQSLRDPRTSNKRFVQSQKIDLDQFIKAIPPKVSYLGTSTHAWGGIDQFFKPGCKIPLSDNGAEVAWLLPDLDPDPA